MEGKFQPSGIDYIIHVLGDQQRDNYLSNFQNGDFKYVATIRKEFTDYEYWIERANWFFYRKLYQSWHPVFANAYELYWERNNRKNEFTLVANYNVEIERIDESSVKISVETDKNVNGIADVYIDYSVNKKPKSQLTKFLFQRELKVENTGMVFASNGYYESNYLRAEGAEYIPMPITNGFGELTLTASPKKSAILDLKQVNCNSIYVTTNIIQVANLTDENWNGGIHVLGKTLLFNYANQLASKLKNAEQLIVNNENFVIESVEFDEQWIRVTVDKDAFVCMYPNNIQIK